MYNEFSRKSEIPLSNQRERGYRLDTEHKRTFIINVIFIAIILALAYLAVKYVLAWLMPFVLALLVATILQKPIGWISKKTRVKKNIAAVLVTLLAVVVFLLLVWLLAYSGINTIVSFARTLPVWFQNTAPSVAHALEVRFQGILDGLPPEWEGQFNTGINNMIHAMESSLTSFSAGAVRWAAGTATKLPGMLLSTIICIVATFFMSIGFDGLRDFFKRQLPFKYRSLASTVWNTSGRTLVKMLQGYILILLITFGELAIGLTLLRIDYSVLIAVAVALLDILPVVGTGTVLIPWSLISLLIGKIPQGIGLLVLYITITVVRNIIEPRIIGARIGLHPLATLIFMYLGLHLFGVIGMLLLPLIIILLKNAQDAGVLKIWK